MRRVANGGVGGVDGLWDKLRHRKVVQWGLVYVAAAWGFLQGLEYVSEAFEWPTQLRQIALIAFLIGLPIVLVLAWYHGDRGQQRISTPEFAIQSDVASAIADALQAKLTPSERDTVNAMPTQNLAAWEAYQLGRQAVSAGRPRQLPMRSSISRLRSSSIRRSRSRTWRWRTR